MTAVRSAAVAKPGRAWRTSRVFGTSALLVAGILSSNLMAAPPGLVDEVASGSADGSAMLNALFAGLGLLSIAVVTVGALTAWSRRQDRLSIMTSLSMRSLIEARGDAASAVAAKTLAGAKDVAALLVLLDVYSDDNVREVVRKAAGEALRDMSRNFSSYREPIEALLAAVGEEDHRTVIDTLERYFEGADRAYAQTALIIGREWAKLGEYPNAREWLQTALYRNRRNPLYGNQIKRLIGTCNVRLFMQGDASFQAGNLQEAKTYFIEGSVGLGEADKRRFAPFLRLACVFCGMGAYEDAAQAISLARQYLQEPETARELGALLDGLLAPERKHATGEEETDRIKREIDDFAKVTINKLAAGAAGN